MIRRFRHRGLKRLYENDDPRELNSEHADKIARMLARLDEATRPEQLDLPGFRLHPLKAISRGIGASPCAPTGELSSALSKATPPMLI